MKPRIKYLMGGTIIFAHMIALHAIKPSLKKEAIMPSIMHDTKISIPEKQRIELVNMLNSTLVSTIDLYNQLKQAHWNVKGPTFIAMHKLFDEIAQGLLTHADTVAERITALGGTTLATTGLIGEYTQLRPYPTDIFSALQHVEHLSHNFAILGEHTRNNIKNAEKFDDYATGDIYIALTRFLDKNLWFLEAHMQK